MTEFPEFRSVEVTHRGKTEIYWGACPMTLESDDANGLDIWLNGRIRTIKHMENLKRGQKINIGDYVGISVFNDGEEKW